MADVAKVQRVELDTLDGVPEALVSLFAQDGEKFVFEYPDVAGLKAALAELKTTKDVLKTKVANGQGSKTKVAAFKVDIDDEEFDIPTLREIIASHRQATGGETMTKAEAETLRKQAIQAVRDEHKRVLEEKDTALTARETELHRYIVHNGLRQFVQSADLGFKLQDGAADALIDHIEATRCFRVVDGKAVWWNGEGPKGTNGDGDPYGFREFVLERVKALPLLKVPSTGTGAHESDGKIRAANKPTAQMSQAEKDDYMKRDPEGWQKKLSAEYRDGKFTPKRTQVTSV